MSLLGGVDQQKEKRERAGGHGALLDRQAVDPAQKRFQGRGIALVMTPRPGCDAELFDDLEGLLSLEPQDHPSERGSEPADILVEREVLGTSLWPCKIAPWVGEHLGCQRTSAQWRKI